MNDDLRVRDPKIMMGKPVIRGTRIPVELILEKLAGGKRGSDSCGASPLDPRRDTRGACLCRQNFESR